MVLNENKLFIAYHEIGYLNRGEDGDESRGEERRGEGDERVIRDGCNKLFFDYQRPGGFKSGCFSLYRRTFTKEIYKTHSLPPLIRHCGYNEVLFHQDCIPTYLFHFHSQTILSSFHVFSSFSSLFFLLLFTFFF